MLAKEGGKSSRKINNIQRTTCARGWLNLSSAKSVSERVSVYVFFCRRRRRLNLYVSIPTKCFGLSDATSRNVSKNHEEEAEEKC